MIEFQFPELLLLTIPVWFAFHRTAGMRPQTAWLLVLPAWTVFFARGGLPWWSAVAALGAAGWGGYVFARQYGPANVTAWLRLTVMAALFLAISGPEVNIGGRGIDVIVVADRSRSVSDAAHKNVVELIGNLDRNRGSGDRVAVIAVGGDSTVERTLKRTGEFSQFEKEVPIDGTDLNSGILDALNLVDHRRPARILVLSDGEANGASPLSAARRAREAGVPVDYRIFERVHAGDVAVQSLELPQQVSPREPFQFSVRIYSDGQTAGTVRLLRDGREVSRAGVRLHSGTNQLTFGDALDRGGSVNYVVEVDVQDDPVPENNTGAGVIRVDPGPRLLVLNEDGKDDNLVRALRSGEIPVDVVAAKKHPVTPDSLERYRAVIVENIPAEQFGRLKMQNLAQYVEDLGGGLLLTGGERSFGVGGYYKSPLEDVLPVSMELREEHRKTQVAIAVALDRSGSMRARVRGGMTKMDLANLGAAEVVNLLSPHDKLAVIAVDTAPAVIQELADVRDKAGMAARVKSIECTGGGIWVHAALTACGKELLKAKAYKTRHIILFADARDAERPGNYRQLLAEYEKAGITVSVIGLGNEGDKDAALLKDIAKLGRGNVLFTEDARELPRLFSQDAMSIARSTFIKKTDEQPRGISAKRIDGPHLIGSFGTGRFPNADGYNLSYLKEQAQAVVVSADELKAPWLAYWFRGTGRAAAITLEVDGEYTGAFGSWQPKDQPPDEEGYAGLLVMVARWLLSGEDPNAAFVELKRDGQDAVVTVELDANRTGDRDRPPILAIIPPGDEREQAFRPQLEWTGLDTLEARFRLDRIGTYRTLVETHRRSATGGKEFVRGPSVTLPYSPEFLHQTGRPSGRETLERIAELSAGRERTNVLEVLADPPRSPQMLSLLPILMIGGIGLLLVEIAGRRLGLWVRAPRTAAVEAPIPATAGWKRWLPRWRLGRRKHATVPTQAEPIDATPAPRPIAKPTAAALFDEAKERARRRRHE